MDPRVEDAVDALLAAQAALRSEITELRPADPDRRAESERLLKEFAELRGGALWYPYLGSGRGNGALVELIDGSVKLDCIGGIGAHPWGHGSALLQRAAVIGALEDTVMQGNLQQNLVSKQVLSGLLALANDERFGAAGMAHGVLTTSGAMANENALKIAFQAAMPARRVFAFDHAFAGRTLALAQVTDKAAYREGLPPTITVDHVPFPEDESGLWRCLDAMDRARQRFPGDHAAFIIEAIQGEGGYTVGHGPSLRALCQRCQDAGILVIADEVQTFGRLQAPFACQYFGFADLVDIIAIGKATQVCATLYTAAVKPRPGLVSQTFTGSSTALHACAAIIDALGQGDFHGEHGRISQIESRCHRHLELLADEGLVRGPYGAGAMVACTPLGGGRQEVLALAQECFAEGLIAFVCGADPMRLRLLLPFGVISDGQIDQAFALLGRVLRRHQQELSG